MSSEKYSILGNNKTNPSGISESGWYGLRSILQQAMKEGLTMRSESDP